MHSEQDKPGAERLMAKLIEMRRRMFEAPKPGASLAECLAWATLDDEGVPRCPGDGEEAWPVSRNRAAPG